MKIYHYNSLTKEYVGTGQAAPDPLDKGNWLIPAHATTIAPPMTVTNEVAIFYPAKQVWQVHPDHRGQTWYRTDDGTTIEITKIGTPDNKLTSQPPPNTYSIWDEDANAWITDINALRQAKIAALAVYRHDRETKGLTINGMIVAADPPSQARIAGAKAYVDLNPSALIEWKGKNGWVQIDAGTVKVIAQAVGAHIQACFINERAHAEAINALPTTGEIEVYDFKTGWPA